MRSYEPTLLRYLMAPLGHCVFLVSSWSFIVISLRLQPTSNPRTWILSSHTAFIVRFFVCYTVLSLAPAQRSSTFAVYGIVPKPQLIGYPMNIFHLVYSDDLIMTTGLRFAYYPAIRERA